VARAAVAKPVDTVVNIGGPHKISFADLARRVLSEQGVDKSVVVDPHATYFGTPLRRDSLVTV
jgi:dTDP-4-dehydrorhamnose reductase